MRQKLISFIHNSGTDGTSRVWTEKLEDEKWKQILLMCCRREKNKNIYKKIYEK